MTPPAAGARLLFDTAPIVYLLEGHPLARRFEPLFARVERGELSALITPITLAEVVSGPIRHGREGLAERYRRALTGGVGWSLCALDADVAMLAARQRLRCGLKLPDALQLAAAVRHGCDALVTHDRDFRAVRDLPILGLDG